MEIVTIPEGLGVSQTERIWNDFNKFGINIGGVIVNNLIPESSSLTADLLKKRWEVQTRYMEIIEKDYSDTLLVKLPLQEYEVKGIKALKEIEKQLYS